MVEGVGQRFRATPSTVRTGLLTVVATKRDHAREIVALGVVGARGVDGHGARLRHDEFAPRVQIGFKINHEHRCEIDQFNGSGFSYAMGNVADQQADFVNAVRELAVRRYLREGLAVGKERGPGCRMVVAVKDTGTSRNNVAVQ